MKKIVMGEGDRLELELPGGMTAIVEVIPAEDPEATPSLDLSLSSPVLVDCWLPDMRPGIPIWLQPWSVHCTQMTIPLTLSEMIDLDKLSREQLEEVQGEDVTG